MSKASGVLTMGGLLAAILLWGCSDSAVPDGDREPPLVDVLLRVEDIGTDCPYWPRLSADPRGSSDNESDASQLRIRWDFFNDGEWDGEFTDLDILYYQFPEPPLDEVWSLRCEVQDEAGNSRIWTGTLDYPVGDWPLSPDIVAAAIAIIPVGVSNAGVDTMVVGQEYLFRAFRRDWLPESELPYELKYYIDDMLVFTTTTGVYSGPSICVGQGVPIAPEFITVGTHEFCVTLDSGDAVAETDETNNTSCRSVVVVE